jgi:outer membrane protein OmpA-like peptidoglycan-associated protein
MKITGLMAGTVALGLLGTGCATKKYVAKTVAPVEGRVTSTETKNTEQDKEITAHAGQIDGLESDLSRTKEKLSDTDNKAAQAGEAAKAADQKAGAAQQAADTAHQTADAARTFAEQGITRLDHSIEAANKYQMVKSETVLFGFDKDMLTKDGKAQLDDIAKQVDGMDRFVIEVQGFTDKTGSPRYNENLSERRAESVVRYLANEHKIPVRAISMLGSGYALPVTEGKTRDDRKMNRRVEVRVWVPESQTSKNTASVTPTN